VLEDWYILWARAKRLGKTIKLDDVVELGMEGAPTTDELMAIRERQAPV